MNISTRAKLSVEREPVIGQTLIDMRGRKPAWEGIGRCGFQGDVWKDELAVMIPAALDDCSVPMEQLHQQIEKLNSSQGLSEIIVPLRGRDRILFWRNQKY